MNYRIGLSLDISSVGWAVIELNKENNPIKIVDFGVRLFDTSENAKDGISMTKIRTLKRTNRRRIRRRKRCGPGTRGIYLTEDRRKEGCKEGKEFCQGR